jgi:hypothetical protein
VSGLPFIRNYAWSSATAVLTVVLRIKNALGNSVQALRTEMAIHQGWAR